MKPLLLLFAVWNTISALRFLLADLFYGRACSCAKMGDFLLQSMQTATKPDREKLATAFRGAGKLIEGAVLGGSFLVPLTFGTIKEEWDVSNSQRSKT